MKRITNIITIVLLLFVSACTDVDYEIDETYENAEILAVALYNIEANRADFETKIESEKGTAIVKLRGGEEITKLKLTITISTGATVVPALPVGIQNLTDPITFDIVSPNKTVVKSWTITVIE